MDIDVRFGGTSLPIRVDNPFRMDVGSVSADIERFVEGKGIVPRDLHLRELLPGMVSGICGCEQGCPADAQGFVRRGCRDYRLEYVEGGILKATLETLSNGPFEIRMFPEF